MSKFWKFLRGVFTAGSPESSKRFFGAIGWLSAIVIIYIWRLDLTETLLFVSAALIGLETMANIFTKKNDNNKPTE